MLVDCCVQRCRGRGNMSAVGRRRPQWSGCVLYHKLTPSYLRVKSPPTQKPTKNQPLSDQLAIYCDDPGYKVRSYDTEKLFYDLKENCFPGNLFLTNPSKDSIWAIRRQYIYSLTAMDGHDRPLFNELLW